jgi:uncharacterized protein
MQPQEILVSKLNPHGQETWHYTGRVLERGAQFIRLEAKYNRDDTPFHGIVLRHGDRFIETYFADRWYNIYEIHDVQTGTLKGWYCNVARPAEIGDERVAYVDLALDLCVYPDGRQLVLDEDEFAELGLAAEESQAARSALRELQELFQRHD